MLIQFEESNVENEFVTVVTEEVIAEGAKVVLNSKQIQSLIGNLVDNKSKRVKHFFF